MTEQLHLTDCPKFTLLLKSHTQKKRLIEAKNKLLNIYPFEVEEQKLLIIRTDKKGKYDVYISNEEIKHDLDIKKLLFISLLCVIALCSLVIIMHNITAKKLEEVTQQKELERQKAEETKILKEKEEKLKKINAEYMGIKESECQKIYPFIERVYSAMTDKTTIENISIDRNIFTVEVTTKDSITILSNFENNNAFNTVKMTRTNIKDARETVSYTGEFARFIKTADDSLSLHEKIAFYTEEINRINKRAALQQAVQLSEYIKNIRTVLHKNNCHEQYIQLRGKDNNAEIEFFVLSTSRNILNFINEIQNEENNLIDIKNIRIHNSEERNRIQTTICFDTGIELKQDDQNLAEYTDLKIESSEIDRIFYKTPVQKTAVSKSSVIKNVQPKKNNRTQVPLKLKKLTYVGLTKSNGNSLVIVKDDDMGSIYKLILTETEINGDCCMQTAGGFKAKIRGEYYEVKK